MVKKIFKNIYKQNVFARNIINYIHPRFQEYYYKFKDIYALNGKKLRLIGKVRPYTMVGYLRLSKIFELTLKLNKENIAGDFVECGVWNGGSGGIISFVAQNGLIKRDVWLFDSFEGLPEPTLEDGELAASYIEGPPTGRLKSIGHCVGSELKVKELFFNKLKLDSSRIHIIKGWFQNTIYKSKDNIGKIAFLHLDSDWYKSTRICLKNLYPKVVKGGYIILDDYGCWKGCKKAIDEFMEKNNIKANLTKIDSTGVYFRKP